MKKLIALLFLALSLSVSAARENHKIPDKIAAAIKKSANHDFPDDFTTQAYVIKTQKEAFINIVYFAWDKRVPVDVQKRIRAKAFKDFGNKADFTTMLYVMKTQQQAYLKIL